MRKTNIISFLFIITQLCITNIFANTIYDIFISSSVAQELNSFLYVNKGITSESYEPGKIKPNISTDIYTKLDMAFTNHDKRKIFHEQFGKTIKTLSLNFLRNVNPTYINKLKERHSGLTELDFLNCDKIKPENFKEWITCFSGLKFINFLESLPIKECHPLLTELDFSYCSYVKTNDFKEWIACFPKITSVNFSDLLIGDDVIKIVAEYCKELENADLSECLELTSNSIMSLAQHCKKLKKILMPPCIIYWKVIPLLAENCPDLQVLNVSECNLAVAFHSLRVSGNFLDLQELNLKNCNIYDTLIISWVKNCSKLQEINLYGNKKLTDASINALAENCPNLQTLNVSDCSFTIEPLNSLIKNCPQLKEIFIYSCKFSDTEKEVLRRENPRIIITG